MEARNSELKAALMTKMPAGRKRKADNFMDEYQEICDQLNKLVKEEGMDLNALVLLERVKLLLEFFLHAINDGQATTQMAGVKVDDVIL